MSYALHLHEIEHGPAVMDGDIPPNAGQTTIAGPDWVFPARPTRFPEAVYLKIWFHMATHGAITRDEIEAFGGTVKLAHGMAQRSEGRMVTRRGRFGGWLWGEG